MDFGVDVIVGKEVQVALDSICVFNFRTCFVIVKLYTSRLPFECYTNQLLYRQNLNDHYTLKIIYLIIFMCQDGIT